MPDSNFHDVGQHTSKRLPRLSWRRLSNMDTGGRTMVGLFVGTLAVLLLLILAGRLLSA